MVHPVRAQERLQGWRCSDFLFGDRPCEDSRVLLTRGCTGVQQLVWWRPVAARFYSVGTAMQWSGWHQGRRGWSQRANGDGGDRSCRPIITALSLHGRGVVVRLPSRAPSSFLEGAVRRPYGSGWHSATGLLLTMPHSVAQWRGWPRHGSWRSSVGA
jgi:hypothetical protein